MRPFPVADGEARLASKKNAHAHAFPIFAPMPAFVVTMALPPAMTIAATDLANADAVNILNEALPRGHAWERGPAGSGRVGRGRNAERHGSERGCQDHRFLHFSISI